MIGSGTSNEVQHLDMEQAALARTCAILFVEHLAKENVKAEHQNEVQLQLYGLKCSSLFQNLVLGSSS